MNLAATAVTHFYDPLFGKQIIVACMGADSTLRGVNCVGSLVANLSSSIFTYLSIHFHSWLPTFVSVWLSEMRLSRLFFLEASSARDHCACATGDGDILIKLFFRCIFCGMKPSGGEREPSERKSQSSCTWPIFNHNANVWKKLSIIRIRNYAVFNLQLSRKFTQSLCVWILVII